MAILMGEPSRHDFVARASAQVPAWEHSPDARRCPAKGERLERRSIMANPTTEPRLPVVVSPYANEEPMPAGATGSMFLVASGFGIGALLILFVFVFMIGIGELGHNPASAPTPAAQSASTAPIAPGPAPNPAPSTGGNSVPTTTGQAPA